MPSYNCVRIIQLQWKMSSIFIVSSHLQYSYSKDVDFSYSKDVDFLKKIDRWMCAL
jgi:hypothetical protein